MIKNIKKLEGFGVINTEEYIYESDEVKPNKYSEYGQMKDLVQTLNLMNSFLILLVVSYMGSQLKNIKDFLVFKYETISN